jgi:hypothetical protein
MFYASIRYLDVTSTVQQQYIAGHCTCTRYGFQFVLFHKTDVQTWVRRYCNIYKGADATVRPVPPGTYRYA